MSAAQPGKGIYIASKTAHAARWRDLRAAGLPINSTWIDEAGPGETRCFADLWRRCISEAALAGATIVYREPGETLKGAFVEAGAALASFRFVFAVGCDDLSFTHHAGVVRCHSLDEAIIRARAAIEPLAPQHTAEANCADLFAKTRIFPAPGHSVGARTLYEIFRAWCEEVGYRPWKETAFHRWMAALGYVRRPGGKGMRIQTYVGITVAQRMAEPDAGWGWWASEDEESYTVGPEKSREAIIAAAKSEELGADNAEEGDTALTFYIMEGRQTPVDLSRNFDSESAIEHMMETAHENHGNPDGNDLTENAWTTEQHADLDAMLTATVAAWQAKHSISITPWLFTETRNSEAVTVKVDAEAVDSTCIACAQPLRDGDPFYEDVNEGPMHAACCGPEPEAFVGMYGEPLKPGDPIPAPGIFRNAQPTTEG